MFHFVSSLSIQGKLEIAMGRKNTFNKTDISVKKTRNLARSRVNKMARRKGDDTLRGEVTNPVSAARSVS